MKKISRILSNWYWKRRISRSARFYDPLLAFDTVKSYRPDAILLDLAMPKLNGWDIFKIIKNDPEFARIPIAILTAKSQAVDEMVGLHVMKADEYITKPFGKQELIDKTHGLFKKNKK